MGGGRNTLGFSHFSDTTAVAVNTHQACCAAMSAMYDVKMCHRIEGYTQRSLAHTHRVAFFEGPVVGKRVVTPSEIGVEV